MLLAMIYGCKAGRRRWKGVRKRTFKKVKIITKKRNKIKKLCIENSKRT